MPEIKQLIRLGMGNCDIARRFHCHHATISQIRHDRLYRDIE